MKTELGYCITGTDFMYENDLWSTFGTLKDFDGVTYEALNAKRVSWLVLYLRPLNSRSPTAVVVQRPDI